MTITRFAGWQRDLTGCCGGCKAWAARNLVCVAETHWGIYLKHEGRTLHVMAQGDKRLVMFQLAACPLTPGPRGEHLHGIKIIKNGFDGTLGYFYDEFQDFSRITSEVILPSAMIW